MPFTQTVYNQLISGAYTHVIFSHSDNHIHNGTEKSFVILEPVKPDTHAKSDMMPIQSREVQSFLLSTTTNYYIRSKNVTPINETNRSYHTSYSKAQAIDLQCKYEFLVNKPFTINGAQLGTINCVTIAPFDEINKWIFFQFYASAKDVSKALMHYYVPYYDVMVIGTLKGTNEYMFESLQTYLRINDMDTSSLPGASPETSARSTIEV